jgi:hypothetical protein
VTRGVFLTALVDSIAPGGHVAANVVLPAASTVGCDEALAKALDGNTSLKALVDEISARGGSAQAFIKSSNQERQSLLEALQIERPIAFAGLVTLILAHYYAQPPVLAGLDWPARPPQPEGHVLRAFDEKLLAPVLGRGEIWRRC